MAEDKKIYPKASDFNSMHNYFDHILNSRESCSQRGYHRVSSEPKEENETMICYDCDLWFDKEFAVSCGLEYRVEPI